MRLWIGKAVAWLYLSRLRLLGSSGGSCDIFRRSTSSENPVYKRREDKHIHHKAMKARRERVWTICQRVARSGHTLRARRACSDGTHSRHAFGAKLGTHSGHMQHTSQQIQARLISTACFVVGK